MRSRGAEIRVVEGPHGFDRESLERLLGREDAAVGMIGIEQRAESLERHLLRLALRDRELADPVPLQARQLRLREFRVADHVGDQRRHLRAGLRQHVRADVGSIRRDGDCERASHSRGRLRDLRRRLRFGALREQVSHEIGEPGFPGLLVDVAGADGQAHGDFRKRSVRDQRDGEAVVERELAGRGDREPLGLARLGRRLFLREESGRYREKGERENRLVPHCGSSASRF